MESAPGDSTRPITDRVKEALFNIIGPAVIDTRFLDLFGGTGSVGIEALSRGAARAVFVERDRMALRTIGRNLQNTGLAGRARVIKGDAFRFLERPGDELFEYVYIAPPQWQGLWLKALRAADCSSALVEEGFVVVQIHPKELPAEGEPMSRLTRLELYDERRYGSTLLRFYYFPSRNRQNLNGVQESPSPED